MIIRNIEGKEYTFAMTRRGLRMAEKQGFNINDVAEKPISAMYYLWYAALYAKQPMSMDKSDNLLDAYLDENTDENMETVMSWLSEQFVEVFGRAVE